MTIHNIKNQNSEVTIEIVPNVSIRKYGVEFGKYPVDKTYSIGDEATYASSNRVGTCKGKILKISPKSVTIQGNPIWGHKDRRITIKSFDAMN